MKTKPDYESLKQPKYRSNEWHYNRPVNPNAEEDLAKQKRSKYFFMGDWFKNKK